MIYKEINKDLPILEIEHELGDINFVGGGPIENSRQHFGRTFALEEFVKHLRQHKQQILELLLSLDQPRQNKEGDGWLRESHAWLLEHTRVDIKPVVDSKGFEMGPHRDNRKSVVSGVFNVDDNPSPTVFSYDQSKHKILYQAPPQRNKGVLWLNTPHSFHGVQETDQPRKIILINFELC